MELLYHYLWHNKMFGRTLKANDGRPVEILFPGRHNDDAGPDFADARLRIDGCEWCGNIEIHIKASDWYRHNHHSDPAYDNVILHVVTLDDALIRRSDGSQIPTTCVNIPQGFYTRYAELSSAIRDVRCASMLHEIPAIITEDWLESLSIQRLQSKAERLLEYIRQMNGDREQGTFTLLARGLGFGLNGLPFELLAKNLPLGILYHHADDLMQLEALLFGRAGMLDPSLHIYDPYYQQLCAEFSFLAKKYNLRPMDHALWKYARTRPQNFPHRRIALLAKMIHDGTRFTAGLLDAGADATLLHRFFSRETGEYWRTHYAFGAPAATASAPAPGKPPAATLSAASRILLMINVAAPFLMAHARLSGEFDIAEKGCDLLRSLPPERNMITRAWERLGIHPCDALRSQALIHLRTEYCDKGRCLECRLGHHLLRREALPTPRSPFPAQKNADDKP